MTLRILSLPGDGIGPEVTSVAVRVLTAAAARAGFEVEVSEAPLGLVAAREHGDPLPDDTVRRAQSSDAVLLGAVDTVGARALGLEGAGSAVLRLRAHLGLWASLRPVSARLGVAAASPLRPETRAGADLLIVRELSGGLYRDALSPRAAQTDQATDRCEYTEEEILRVVRLAFRLAAERRGRLTSVDKSNVMETSRLWRECVQRERAAWPGVEVEHRLVDSFALDLVTRPAAFDVVVTENLFGDILSDEAAAIAGSLGLLGSASLGDPGVPGIFEPVHGSAPGIAGSGTANPVGAILAAAMLLDHNGAPAAARALEAAVAQVLATGPLTPDLGGRAGTAELGEAVLRALEAGSPGGPELGAV
ncbi:MAG: isocitrate/isopropylmalate dehydrogenase family protein [Candidatus Dormibacteria bacterium]